MHTWWRSLTNTLRERFNVKRMFLQVTSTTGRNDVPNVVRTSARQRHDVITRSGSLGEIATTVGATESLLLEQPTPFLNRVGAGCSFSFGPTSSLKCRALIWMRVFPLFREAATAFGIFRVGLSRILCPARLAELVLSFKWYPGSTGAPRAVLVVGDRDGARVGRKLEPLREGPRLRPSLFPRLLLCLGVLLSMGFPPGVDRRVVLLPVLPAPSHRAFSHAIRVGLSILRATQLSARRAVVIGLRNLEFHATGGTVVSQGAFHV